MPRSSVLLHFFQIRRWKTAAILAGLGALAASAPVRAEAEAMAPSPQPGVPVPEAVKLDVLVYTDGDRVRGHLVERSVDLWLFQSERFGLLKVPLADAKVILANPESGAAAARAKAEETEAENASFLRWSILSPRALAETLGDFFGPWHGRFALSTQVISNTTETTVAMAEAHLQRKWTKDSVKLDARYDFSDTNHVTTTDIIRADASWRHDFPDRLFSLYSPAVEWNRAYFISGVPSDYVLLQQEVGMGVTIFALPRRNLRVGVAENFFNVWQTVAPESQTESSAESLFLEADWKLPWRMTLTERGIWYYSIASSQDGWENKLELDKKLTETFLVGIRHETRYHSPDARVQDYTLLKLLMGIDF